MDTTPIETETKIEVEIPREEARSTVRTATRSMGTHALIFADGSGLIWLQISNEVDGTATGFSMDSIQARAQGLAMLHAADAMDASLAARGR